MIALATVVGAGCGSSGASRSASPEEAYITLSDATARNDQRIDAIDALREAVASGTTSRDTARTALKRIAWSWHQGTPSDVRIAAVDALLADDVALDDTRTMLTLMTPTEQQREVLEHVCAIAIEHDWRSMTPALVRSWSREVPGWDDEDRPEGKAIAALWPQSEVTTVLFDIFSGAEGADDKARSAAWAMLTRLDTDGAGTRALVQEAAPTLEASGDELAGAIGRAWRELKTVPQTTEQLAWAQRLFSPERDAERRDFVQAVGTLPAEQANGLALRHGPVLAWALRARPDLMEMSSDQLRALVREGMTGSRAYGPSGRADRRDVEELAWLDLLVAVAALDALSSPDITSALFVQADDDQLDRSTEHGGVINAQTSGGWQAVAFAPRPTERFGDQQFVASDDMVKFGDVAQFHYHFHAQKHGNRDYATPSGGDYETARRLGRSSLVLTFVDTDHMNVDLYFPDGLTIDLGTIERPQ